MRATGSEVTPSTGDRVPPIFVSGRFARLQELVPGYTTTISDNLGESARDMLIFPIPSDMRAQERDATRRSRFVSRRDSRIVYERLSTLCSHFICNCRVRRPSLGDGIVPLLHVRRFHRFAVSPRAIFRALGIPKVNRRGEITENFAV